MIVTRKYRIYPTPEQTQRLEAWFSVCRFVYNHTRTDWCERFRRQKFSWVRDPKKIAIRKFESSLPSQYDHSKEWTQAWKELPDAERAKFEDCPSNAWRSAIVDFHVAVKAFMSGKVKGGLDGLRYRSFYDDQSFELPVRTVGKSFKNGYQTNIWFGPRQFMLVKGKNFKLDYKKHRRLGGNPKTIRVIREGRPESSQYYICVTVEVGTGRDRSIRQESVGVDFGIAQVSSLSTGDAITPIEYTTVLPRMTKRMKRLQRELARSRRGSKRRSKRKLALKKIHARISDVRGCANHRMTTAIARAFSTVVVEDLRVRNMTKSAAGSVEAPGRSVKAKSGLNREILNRSPFQIRSQLTYKIGRRGGTLIAINPARTSQTCSDCHVVDSASRRSQSDFICTSCGFTINADHNAAINILARGISDQTGAVPVPRKTPSGIGFEMTDPATSKSARWMTESGLHRSDLAALRSSINQLEQRSNSISVPETS